MVMLRSYGYCKKPCIQLKFKGEVMAIDVNSENLETEVLAADGVIVADFWAPWCGPCRKLGPVLEELEKSFEGKMKLVKINADENLEIMKQFSVSGLPSLLVFKNGEAVERMAGLIPKSSIVNNIEKHL